MEEDELEVVWPIVLDVDVLLLEDEVVIPNVEDVDVEDDELEVVWPIVLEVEVEEDDEEVVRPIVDDVEDELLELDVVRPIVLDELSSPTAARFPKNISDGMALPVVS